MIFFNRKTLIYPNIVQCYQIIFSLKSFNSIMVLDYGCNFCCLFLCTQLDFDYFNENTYVFSTLYYNIIIKIFFFTLSIYIFIGIYGYVWVLKLLVGEIRLIILSSIKTYYYIKLIRRYIVLLSVFCYRCATHLGYVFFPLFSAST